MQALSTSSNSSNSSTSSTSSTSPLPFFPSTVSITKELHKELTIELKINRLQCIYEGYQLNQNQLSKIHYHCTILEKNVNKAPNLALLSRIKEQARQKIEEHNALQSTSTPFGRKAKRPCPAGAIVACSSCPTSVLEVSLENNLSGSSGAIIDEMELAIFSEIRKCCERTDLDEQSMRWIIIQLEHYFNTFNKNKEAIAFRIGQLYEKINKINVDQFEKINDLNQATHYYQAAADAGCKRSFWRLVVIALNKKNFDGCITILKKRISLPLEFYDKDAVIKILPTINENEMTEDTTKTLKSLATAYHHLDNTVVATRLLDLAGNIGDSEIKTRLLNTVKEENKTLIAHIEELNRGFRATILSYKSAHMENPAKEKLQELASKLLKNGHITSYQQLFSNLMVDIVANEALSSYLCSINNRCDQPTSCLATSLKLCESLKQRSPDHPLVAWVFVAIKSLSTTSASSAAFADIDRLATIAQTEGFSDPRVKRASLYAPTQLTTPLSSLFVFEVEDDDSN